MSSSFNVSGPVKKQWSTSNGPRSRQDVVVLTSNGEHKFIGGAEKARRVARQGGNRIMRPDEKQRLNQRIPVRLNPFERFYAGMLRSSAEDFLSSKDTWRIICQRLGLPVPEGPLPAVYPDGKQHFFYRAALVIEEARFAVAEGLAKLDRQYKTKANGSHRRERHHDDQSLSVKLHGSEQNDKTGHSVLIFVSEKAFSLDHLDALRTGTVFACCPVSVGREPSLATAILASILPSSRDDMISEKKLGLMVFSGNVPRAADWVLTPLTNLITQQRMYEACTSKDTTRVPFLHPLLGGKASTHTRFGDGPDGEAVAAVPQKAAVQEDADDIVPWEQVRKVFSIPQLNPTQEKAARSYLQAEANTITLVQGPPGSGKTMLLVSVICRYVMESIHRGISRSLMICAPTNKAVSVLCHRFMGALKDEYGNLPCNVVLVGDEDKLVGDGYGKEHKHRHSSETAPLRSIFLYTWIQTVLDEYGRIKRYITAKRTANDMQLAIRLSRQLQMRLSKSLSLSKSICSQMRELTNALEGAAQGNLGQKNVALSTVEDILVTVGQWKNEDVWQELLGSANLIFCTLASSGASILKKSIRAVNDLIVDEAAAATEPEIYIPFQYRPERLLAVGDPKQLPATVLSHVAEDRGMSRSLHERLMFDCNHKFTMLDVQYRMRPELSQFPSKTFYNAKLVNGPNVTRPDYGGAVSLLNDMPYSFLQISGGERQSNSGSYENHAEAEAIAKLVVDLQRLSRNIPGCWSSPDRIRIITFYQAQVSLIKRKLQQRNCSHVLVATVDSSQGCEADIVIVSFVRSTSRNHRETVGFLSDDRRLNVAITRAKYQLICVGDAEHMMGINNPKAATIRSLTCDAWDRGCIIPGEGRGRADFLPVMREKRLRAMDAEPQNEAKKPRSLSLHEGTRSPRYTSNELKAFLCESDEGDSDTSSQTSSSSSSSSSSSTSSSSTSSSSAPSKDPLDLNGTAKTPIVIEDDDSEGRLPLNQQSHVIGRTMEKTENEGDRVAVKTEACFTATEAKGIEDRNAGRISASLGCRTNNLSETETEMEKGGGIIAVKTELATKMTDDLALSQDESIEFGGLSVDV